MHSLGSAQRAEGTEPGGAKPEPQQQCYGKAGCWGGGRGRSSPSCGHIHPFMGASLCPHPWGKHGEGKAVPEGQIQAEQIRNQTNQEAPGQRGWESQHQHICKMQRKCLIFQIGKRFEIAGEQSSLPPVPAGTNRLCQSRFLSL